MKIRFDQKELVEWATQVLKKTSMPESDAKTTATILVKADLRGIETHGLARLPIYVERIKKGGINPKPNFKILKETSATSLIDADSAMGQVAGQFAMSKAIEKANQTSVGISSVRNGNHFGIVAHYLEMALNKNMFGIATTNTSPLLAPFGGRKAILGTNPIAFGFPGGQFHPIILDMASSVTSRGRIKIAQLNNEKIPLTWAVDERGIPTDDPNEALKGALLPFGAHKGYGLAVIGDILSSVLSGAGYLIHTGELYKEPEKPQNLGFFMMAVKLEAFIDIDEFNERITDFIKTIKESPKAEGTKEIFMPGEIEYIRESENIKEGTPLGENVVKELKELGNSVGIEFNLTPKN
ncbi:Malate dehydrogenase [Thermodesulfobium narugense DSM 14796]|uniref:Malate dehydrogenase n=1 Tax=Thermodesulfobium narugense DSM 14796 TaxID=747365 RepID=M1E9C0_9BACT|nr:Ldh family oxidoreductase [Thermodesulfobium narugense]AEE15039.1 Malate dehydrogenase [Thermodesulfobium narugense DSM 14796]